MKKILNKISGFFLAITALFTSFNNASFVNAEDYARTYLSDLNPIQSSIGYGSLKKDTNMSGENISYIIDGQRTYFRKGITAHATSTLIYDIGENHPYDYFTSYLGVDASQGGKGDVLFSLFTSSDNSNWTSVIDSIRKTSSDEAISVTIPVNNVQYLKFVFDSNGPNGNDHSGLGNPLLYKANSLYEHDDLIKPVSYYDNLFKNKSYEEIVTDYKKETLQRSLVEQATYDELKYNFLNGVDETKNREALAYLFNNETALEDFVMGGNPNGSYSNALKVFSNLYAIYKNDLNDETSLNNKEEGSTRKLGDLYRTMMIAISLTHADGGPHMWLDGKNVSDPILRYEAYKYSYLEGILRNDVFENLNVEEMRWVMGGRMNNDEIYWLNKYVRLKSPNMTYPNIYSPHRFLAYGKDWDYTGKGYKNIENWETYNEKYHLEEYNLNFSENNHLWMVFEGSHICWGISYTGADFANSFGVPSHYVRQPGHAAFFVYNKNSNNQTIWGIDNNISGWTQTWINEDTVGYGRNRNLCNWGTINNGWSSYNNASYVALSSTALDHYDDYVEAELYMSLDKFASSVEEKESLYKKALSVMPYHLDAYEKLTKLYKNNKSELERVELAKQIVNDMYPFPLAMHDLLNILNSSISDTTLKGMIDNLDITYLKKGTKANSDSKCVSLLAQVDICKVEANYLLNNASSSLASFSFDGENKNSLVFSSQYTNVRFKYSIDGGTSWSDTHLTSDNNLIYQLSDEEINQISAENDILIWLEGWASSKADNAPDKDLAFVIDILEGSTPSGFELNDNENRFLGTINNVEYSSDGGNTFNDLNSNIIFNGDVTLVLRNKATGTTLKGNEVTYHFTDNNSSTRSYIDISRISYVSCSSEETSTSDDAYHAFDGLTSTRWHTVWKGGDNERYIIAKFDNPTILSGIDYTPTGSNGTASAIKIYVSVDGTNYSLAATVSGLTTNNVTKKIDIDPIMAQYVKFQVTNSVGGFASARLIEFFEDTSYKSSSITGINVSKTPEKTSFFSGQEINLNDFEISAVYDNNLSARLPNELITVSDVDTSIIGNQTINISYLGFNTSIDIEILNIAECSYYVSGFATDDINEAINHANEDDVIYVMKDISYDGDIVNINKKVTIDGNGHNVTRNNTSTHLFKVTSSGELKLNNINLKGGANWTGESHEVALRGMSNSGSTSSASMIRLEGTSKLYLNSGVVISDFASSNPGGVISSVSTGDKCYIEINNATFKNSYSTSFGMAIYVRGQSNIVINEGEFFGYSGNVNSNASILCLDDSSSIIINNVYFHNNEYGKIGGAIWVKNGSTSINGGRFVNNDNKTGLAIYSNGNGTITVSDFESLDGIYLNSNGIINFTSSLEDKYLLINSSNKTDGKILATYSNDVNLDELLLALDYKDKYIIGSEDNISINSNFTASVEHERNGKVTYYDSFEKAYEISKAGDSITLLEDITLNKDLIVDKAIDINLGSNTFVGDYTIKASDGHDMVIDNGVIKFASHKHELTISYIWNEDYTTCKGVATCQCGYNEEEFGEVSSSLVSSDCLTNKVYNYEATFFSTSFENQYLNNIQSNEKGEHNLTYISGTDSTCEHTGIKGHDHCKDCNKDFIDGQLVSKDDLIIPLSNHHDETKNYGFITITTTCSTCGEVVSKKVNWITITAILGGLAVVGSTTFSVLLFVNRKRKHKHHEQH